MPFKSYIRVLDKIFTGSKTKREAHRLALPVLQDMAAHQHLIGKALEGYVNEAANLNTLNFPAFGFNLHRNRYYGLALNCFFPSHTGAMDLTSNAIHHHGPSLLTTVACFGPGYEHWLFSKPEVVNQQDNLFKMSVTDCQQHSVGHSAFVDALIPHAVFFPQSLSITYALWSSEAPVNYLDRFKHSKLVQKNSKLITAFLKKARLAKPLGVMAYGYYDYFPVEGGFRGMPDRIQFQRGSNHDFLHGLFHVIQETQNQWLVPKIIETVDKGGVHDPKQVHRMLKNLEHGHKIERIFTAGIHTDVPHMIFKKAAIEKVLS